ncbi:MAG: TonB-dependent receptor [Bacteroidales bacterium]|nr:TonB-dependent receptor [Bacteroidales bacterium]
MRKLILTVFIIILSISAFSQTVNVVNNIDLKPIKSVAIFNSDHSITALTDCLGEADLSEFDPLDTLTFQHPTYNQLVIPFSFIKKLGFKIQLIEKLVSLDEVVISASKWEQKKNEIPNKITTIPPRQIAFNNPQTAADILSISNEVFIQKSQLGGGSPMIRGFAANSVLIVVDGVRMNNAIFRSGNLQNVISIDPNIIENAEVVFGPGSIIYGSDALGGVMDFHTKKVKLSYSEKPRISANSLLRYSSANNEKTAHFDFNYGKKKWGFVTSVTYSDYEDLMMGSVGNDDYIRKEYVEQRNGIDTIINNENENIQKNSAYNQLNILQKIRFNPNKNLDINYGFHYSVTSDIPRYDRLIQYSDEKLKYAEWYYGPQKWMMNNLNIHLSDTTKLYDELKLTMAYQEFEESRNDRKFQKDELRLRTENVSAITMNLDFDKKITAKSTLFYGFEGLYNRVNSSGKIENINTLKEFPTSTRYPDGGSDYSSFAGYMSYKSNISKKITLSSGLRYSRVIMKSKFIDTTFFKFPYDEINLNTGALNASAGMVYRTDNNWQFNVNASSGFRAPNIDDIAKVFDSEPGTLIVPNENLKPEYAYNLDMGFSRNFGDQTKINATIFYTYLDNAMVRRDFTFNGYDSLLYDGEMSKVEALVNTGSAYIYGGSFSVDVNLNGMFLLSSNLTYTKGKDDEGYPVRHVAPLFGSSSITYSKDKLKLKLYSIYNGEISYENLALSERDKTYMYAEDENGNPYSPLWWTINLKFLYQINSRIQLTTGIENIFNYRIRTYSSGICAPGRNFIIALRGSF